MHEDKRQKMVLMILEEVWKRTVLMREIFDMKKDIKIIGEKTVVKSSTDRRGSLGS